MSPVPFLRGGSFGSWDWSPLAGVSALCTACSPLPAPCRYRMLAELVTTGGLALEVSTSLHPESFLLLACTGNFAKAVGKGMSKPAFR